MNVAGSAGQERRVRPGSAGPWLLSETVTERSIGDRNAARATTAMNVSRNERRPSPRCRGGRLAVAGADRRRTGIASAAGASSGVAVGGRPSVSGSPA